MYDVLLLTWPLCTISYYLLDLCVRCPIFNLSCNILDFCILGPLFNLSCNILDFCILGPLFNLTFIYDVLFFSWLLSILHLISSTLSYYLFDTFPPYSIIHLTFFHAILLYIWHWSTLYCYMFDIGPSCPIICLILVHPVLLYIWHWSILSYYMFDIGPSCPIICLILVHPVLLYVWYWSILSYYMFDIGPPCPIICLILVHPVLLYIWHWSNINYLTFILAVLFIYLSLICPSNPIICRPANYLTTMWSYYVFDLFSGSLAVAPDLSWPTPLDCFHASLHLDCKKISQDLSIGKQGDTREGYRGGSSSD